MAINKSKRYTTTGTQDPIDIDKSHHVTCGITSENGDITITSIEALIGNNWYQSASVTVEEGKSYSFTGPVEKIRCTVSNLGTSAYYDFDFCASDR